MVKVGETEMREPAIFFEGGFCIVHCRAFLKLVIKWPKGHAVPFLSTEYSRFSQGKLFFESRLSSNAYQKNNLHGGGGLVVVL